MHNTVLAKLLEVTCTLLFSCFPVGVESVSFLLCKSNIMKHSLHSVFGKCAAAEAGSVLYKHRVNDRRATTPKLSYSIIVLLVSQS